GGLATACSMPMVASVRRHRREGPGSARLLGTVDCPGDRLAVHRDLRAGDALQHDSHGSTVGDGGLCMHTALAGHNARACALAATASGSASRGSGWKPRRAKKPAASVVSR
ncbi:MAG TPA: hypothetical protein PKM48_00955, partial [Parvularculaceae bacterium]|nr:hypothetical protein [Parvularculaceae bacterium]